jgi:DNA-binding LytR/AlgR family response regulator
MRAIIIEDEPQAAERLGRLVRQCRPGVEIIATLESVEDAVAWLKAHRAPDLAFFDIQLSDGFSFSIFEQARIDFPVIFTTAFDEYALRAFSVNSIDYLLKPVDPEDLERAFRKWEQLSRPAGNISPDLVRSVMAMIQQPQYKERFLVRTGNHLRSVTTAEISYFFSADKITWLRLADGYKYPVEQTLEQLEGLLDPARFFRLNRKYLVGIDAIAKLTPYSNSRLRVQLPHADPEERIIVSREKVQPFKAWLEGE